MKKTSIIFLTAIILLLSSCKFGLFPLAFTDDTVQDRVSSIKKLQDNDVPHGTNGNSKYSFVVVTDMHFGADRYDHRHEAFFKWIENRFNEDDPSKRPQFIVNLGDTSDSGRENQFEQFVEWSDKVKSLAKNGKDAIEDFKIYSVIGNHDLYNSGQKYFKDYMYPYTYSYYFDFANNKSTEGFEFFFLDSANGSFGKNQLDDFEEKIDDNKKPKIIFTHYPIYADGIIVAQLQDTLECAKFLTLAAENNTRLILVGHAHREKSYDYGGMYEEITPSYSNKSSLNFITVDEATGRCSTNIIEY